MENNDKNVPKLRFPGFTEAWEQRKLETVVNVQSGRDYKHLNEGSIPVYGTGGYMLSVNDALSHEQDAIGIGRKGTINKPFILKAPFWTVDTLFYAVPKEKFDLGFIYGIFQKVDWKKKDESTGVPSLSKSTINAVSIMATEYNEQTKIGIFFKDLDNLITLHQRKLEKLQNKKKCLLQKMFPKEGEQTPEIRFPEFADNWEQRKLGDVKDVRDGTHDSPKYYEYGHPLVTSKNLKETGLDMSNVSLISDKDFEEINQRSNVNIGDILFGMIGTIGNPVIINRDDFAIKNVALLKKGGEVGNEFLLQLLKSRVFDNYIRVENAGGTQKFLSLSQIRDFKFLAPSEYEQVEIGLFFQSFDNLTTLQQRKISHLKDRKKALLRQMFV